MRLLRRKRHRCPPCVRLQVLIDGELTVGPLTGEELAYIVRYGSAAGDVVDLLNPEWSGFRSGSYSVQVLAEYVPPVT